MKLIDHFTKFLSDEVNLNQSRINRLQEHVEAISGFVQNSDYEAKVLDFSPQGSWAHKTIIKPPKNKEFDADLIVFIEPNDDLEPKDYINKLYNIFYHSDRYKEKVGRGTRCVTLNYSGDFHLDIVPCLKSALLFGNDYEYAVCNRKDNVLEATNPEAYTNWFLERNRWTGNNMLIKTVRLLKYLRDIKTTFSAKSILLTTLVASRVCSVDEYLRDSDFCDLPTSLKALIGRLDYFLQENPTMPTVQNPVMASEDFNRHWDQKRYENFRDKIHGYREWINDAYEEEDRDESIRKWRRILGDTFAQSVVLDSAASVTGQLLAKARVRTDAHDIMSAIKAYGVNLLQSINPHLPYVEKSRWQKKRNQIGVSIRAEYSSTRSNAEVMRFESGDILDKGIWLKFTAYSSRGLPLPLNDYDVQWRVVNTGQDAIDYDSLRGDFYPSDSQHIRWEQTQYFGVHWVEAFVICKRDQKCAGKSERFFVVIGS